MTWLPISGTLPQFTTDGEQANGYVLKFYEIGTTTPLTVSSTSSGTPTTTDFVLDTEGYTTLSSTRVIPHVQTGYKLIMYLNQTDADANDTGSAVWTIDNITLSGTLDNVYAADTVADLEAIDVNLYQTAILKGTSAVADGGQGTYYYDSTSTATDNGTTVLTPDSVGGGAGRWIALAKNSVRTRVVTADETYTPPVNVSEIKFEVIGAGGGSGGVAATGGGQSASAGGGGGGGYVRLSTSTIDASYAVVVGSGGTGGASGNNNGTNGGDSSVTGSTITLTAAGGSGGSGSATGTPGLGTSGNGGAASGGTFNVDGTTPSTTLFGGDSFLQSSVSQTAGTNADGIAGPDYGAGAAGAINQASQSARPGADGGDGVVIITEYL